MSFYYRLLGEWWSARCFSIVNLVLQSDKRYHKMRLSQQSTDKLNNERTEHKELLPYVELCFAGNKIKTIQK